MSSPSQVRVAVVQAAPVLFNREGTLVERLSARGFVLLDAQAPHPHLMRIGAVELPREEYLSRLHVALGVNARF